MPQNQYDYIIAGTGCAGLSLAVHMIHSGKFTNKKILLVDQQPKTENDRTWCFWEKSPSLFESVVHRQWDHLWFYGEGFYKELSIAPYRYKMIRGIDFYNYCLRLIEQHPNFEWRFGKIDAVFSDEQTGIKIDGESITADFVFNSILFEKPTLKKKQAWLLQHFKGWMIETAERTFDTGVATLMDFRPHQENGTTFCYVLPLSDKKALVEYTLFTPSLLSNEAYDAELKHYVEEVLRIKDYSVTETEFGVIPMTDYKFPAQQGNVINIGTAGGQTKGSSGYTFYFIQKHSKAIVDRLLKTGKPFLKKPSPRYHFYDGVLLQILAANSLPGKQIFSTLFKKNSPQNVLTFLNNESTFADDVRLISSLPTLPFLKAAIQKNL